MIVIDKPYVSDFLIKTIKENNYEIVATAQAKNMIADKKLNWITEEEAKDSLKKNPETPMYTNSENTINWIQKNVVSLSLLDQIEVFKNKIKFRELIKESFPDYFFKGVRFEDLRKLIVEELKFPFIIKPAVGFSSIAVHKVDTAAEWLQVLDKIDSENNHSKDLYPKEVLNISEFIIEEYIAGDEYAIDCYFDNKGKPVVLNILHHIFLSDKDVSDKVYSTSQEIIQKYKNEIEAFLGIIGEKAKLKNFPAHVELRIDNKGIINPIEVNPLRFGGFCTTGDLSWYAYGINSYEAFFQSIKPDWETIFKTRKGKKYSIIVLDNNSGIDASEIESFDYEKLVLDFEKPLDLRKIALNEYSVFGFLFTETQNGNEKELLEILGSDLKKYIRLK
ncbi:ATP-grasp domain-containing protein [Bizionia gelidisalsuginis]|uniref:ATP-grasp domain-containing protein n=2 Tax=Bizionia TaxID=283785 RepID=A0A8H2QDW0_9FLAO|nr:MULTISPECIES: ATP-grasp domain-containing protein [Bizionia]TYB72159.1 ATP-grasp domain-containing protein [Bizionia saleffrena]TYC08770.1 ATP-grasp domain-containing protein [Bizionia gelidisalsuginis]